MTAIPDSLLKRIEEWCAEHPTGQIVLNVAEHTVKTYEFRERGKIGEPEGTPVIQRTDFVPPVYYRGGDPTLT